MVTYDDLDILAFQWIAGMLIFTTGSLIACSLFDRKRRK